MTFNEELEDLLDKLHTTNRFSYSMGAIHPQSNIFYFNYGSGAKLTALQEEMVKSLFSFNKELIINVEFDFLRLPKELLEEKLVESYFKILDKES